MHRRTFLQTLAAVAAAPLLPAPAVREIYRPVELFSYSVMLHGSEPVLTRAEQLTLNEQWIRDVSRAFGVPRELLVDAPKAAR